MPILNHNHILHGLSGKIGNIVVRQLNGKTIVQAAPIRKAPATPGEKTNQQNFKQAVNYAKEARQNPKVWAIYLAEAKRRGGTSNAYAVAVWDYRRGLPLAGKPVREAPNLRRDRLRPVRPASDQRNDYPFPVPNAEWMGNIRGNYIRNNAELRIAVNLAGIVNSYTKRTGRDLSLRYILFNNYLAAPKAKKPGLYTSPVNFWYLTLIDKIAFAAAITAYSAFFKVSISIT